MAVGDFWDEPEQTLNGALPSAEELPAEEQVAGPRRVRLALAKVLPAGDGKHRGGGRAGLAGDKSYLPVDDLEGIDEALRRRNDILTAAIKRTQDLYIVNDQRQVFRLAATDLFVEKAQLVLGERARAMWRAGVSTTTAWVALLIGLSAFLVWRTDAVTSSSLSGTTLTLALVEMAGTALVVLVAVKYLIQLSRSFFHENVTLVARQHALGFGRLYVYTNPDAVRLKDLQDAFGLDLDNTPIFLDIKARETADTIYSKVTQDLGLSPGR